MTRVERARGDRIVAVAHSILVIAHALSRRPVLHDLGGDDFAPRADPTWLTRGLVAYLDVGHRVTLKALVAA